MNLKRCYIEYFIKIDEYWNDLFYAGGMIGRATSDEVINGLNGLKEKIRVDSGLEMSEKVELAEIINARLEKVIEKEKEIDEAEKRYNESDAKKHEQFRDVFKQVNEIELHHSGKAELYGNKPGLRASKELRDMISTGYYIFFDPDTLISLYNGDNSVLKEEKGRIKSEYPIMSDDLMYIIDRVIIKQNELNNKQNKKGDDESR